jgi:nitrogen-specific signal transduction histidine kinase
MSVPSSSATGEPPDTGGTELGGINRMLETEEGHGSLGETSTATPGSSKDAPGEGSRSAETLQSRPPGRGNYESPRVSENQDPGHDPSEEVDRLRAAMNAQLRLVAHREKLAKRLLEKETPSNEASLSSPVDRARIPSISEETMSSPSLEAAFASPPVPAVHTASTESGRTIRGEYTPYGNPARTPSYPFPPMRTPRQLSFGGHRPFTALSPTVAPEYFPEPPETPLDRWPSGSVTPASAMAFMPMGAPQIREDPNYPTPNLFDLSLRLSSEPGLDAWWTNVAQIMQEFFKADRVSLAVPADSTDIENVPWGHKATFSTMQEDHLSVGYLPRGSSMVPSSEGGGDFTSSSGSLTTGGTNEGTASLLRPHPPRPELQSRHSFTTFEETKRAAPEQRDVSHVLGLRPTLAARSHSHLPAMTESSVPERIGPPTLEEIERSVPVATRNVTSWSAVEAAPADPRPRIFPVLQALDYEAEPLINNAGVIKVLERGRLIALTRDYPYLHDPEPVGMDAETVAESNAVSESFRSRSRKGKTPEVIQRMSSIFAGGQDITHRFAPGAHDSPNDPARAFWGASSYNDPALPSPKYEEYEQTPPSPWAQSPAPSPAIRSEPAENPFFAIAEVDEESFNPEPAATDYSSARQVEAIGYDRSYTVLHIPLNHPVLSKPVQSFRLDTAVMESKSAQRGKEMSEPFASTPKSHGRAENSGRPTPVAILSILSPVIPYPSNLRHALEYLSPHLATSFSQCQHYSNLEAEIAGLQRRRPLTTGFGAVAPAPVGVGLTYYSPSEDEPRQLSGGSITSPSDYSALSRSIAASPVGTPIRDAVLKGVAVDKRPTGFSPGISGSFSEGYFSSKLKSNATRGDVGAAPDLIAGESRPPAPKGMSPSDSRQQRKGAGEELLPSNRAESPTDRRDTGEKHKLSSEPAASKPASSRSSHSRQVRIERPLHETSNESLEREDPYPTKHYAEGPLTPLRQAMRGVSAHVPTRSTHAPSRLHTGGADLVATFPSLPSGTGNTGAVEMLPPSDRLKTLMLDTLPCHVFVAQPNTGEIVWVNNRYLSYRGQTIPQLRDDPWGTIHPDEREEYLKSWGDSIRTGRPFSKQVRIRRFDGTYRWFFTRAVAGKDTKNVIVQWYGSHMDIHDQHEAEVKAARQEESEASEANYRLLANLIPQIIFAASEDKGIIFANEQWLNYTGQDYDKALELGFMDFVHPEDLAKCRIPFGLAGVDDAENRRPRPKTSASHHSSGGKSSSTDTKSSGSVSATLSESTVRQHEPGTEPALSRTTSSSSTTREELAKADISTLTKSGAVQVTVDINGRQSYTTEVRLKSKTGEYRWHLVRCVEVDNFKFGGDGGSGSWFGACTDINDHKLLETKLKEAMDSKSKFLSNMSHEIRTPLIGISGMVSFLQDTTLNEEQLDFTNTIQTSANSLLSIINDILDLSKVDAGMMKLSFEWFHIRSVIEEVNELVSTMAISKRLELNYLVDEDVPAMVKGDKIRIRQVLLNVIGNAIKFTTVGEVYSTCRVYHDSRTSLEDNEILLEFSIVDTGRGFTKDEAELIFKPFSQIDGSSTRQHGGSGLGLVISRQLVELHGGKMEGSAVPGKGSTFTFTAKFGLPTPDDQPEPLPTPQLSKTPSFRSTHSGEVPTRAMVRTGEYIPRGEYLSHRYLTSPTPLSPRTDPGPDSPAVASSASSDPSVRSIRSYMTGKSSASSLNQGLVNFSEAARASGQDPLSMKLTIPPKMSSDTTPTQESASPMRTDSQSSSSEIKQFRPPMYSILVVCPQTHSREATTKHIEQTLPKVIPYQITTSSSVIESQRMIGGDDPVIFTHIVLNLPFPDEIIALIDQIYGSPSLPQTSIVILSDPVQRTAVIKQAPQFDFDQLAKDNRVTFVYKPVKPSRFAVIFDPDKERELSTDRNRSSAQQLVANQKQNYLDAEAKLGSRGFKILLVEDNLVNQKVLLKYLTKIGVEVEIANDGVECTERVFSRPHGHYSLILVRALSHFAVRR